MPTPINFITFYTFSIDLIYRICYAYTMDRKFKAIRTQMRVAMLQLGHDPSYFHLNPAGAYIVTCHKCGLQAQINEHMQITGEALNAQKSCNAATQRKIQQARENEELFKVLKQLH